MMYLFVFFNLYLIASLRRLLHNILPLNLSLVLFSCQQDVAECYSSCFATITLLSYY